MINAKVRQSDLNLLFRELNHKLDGIKVINSAYNKEQIAKAVFTITATEFIRRTGVVAAGSKKRFHHIYEWGKVGDPAAKLFVLNRTRVLGGRLTISSNFTKSKSVVPIPDSLRIPGRKGRSVTKQFIFKEKAAVMESGKPTKRFSAKSGDALVFPGYRGQPIFIRRPRTVRIINPGGRGTTGSFTRHYRSWFSNPGNVNRAVAKSGLVRALEKEIAAELRIKGAGKIAVSKTIKTVTDKYAAGVVRL